jgi:long-subunit acyl-CoA synthetase (AMP-forming)
MREAYRALCRFSSQNGDKILFSDEYGGVSREDFLLRVSALAQELAPSENAIGILAANGVHWAVAQVAGAIAGKTIVPLPAFFSAEQLGHIVRDANIRLILCSEELRYLVAPSGVTARPIEARGRTPPVPMAEGFGQIIYTSGSTGHPKGVRHGGRQIGWSTAALAAASNASESDSYLSVLPLPLLLETICAILVPLLVGGKTHFVEQNAKAFGSAQSQSIAAMFEDEKPTSSVLVPQLLGAWVEELAASGLRAPPTLRFIAVGGAPTPAAVVEQAWALGIPVYEGYGLSECCSVVALNRSGARKAGTVGLPLPGLRVSIEEKEIVVEGPSVMDGYLGGADCDQRWRTGDLGIIDADGYLTVHGRKDNLLVNSFGRNISPEWIETCLLGDGRIAFCAVFGHGEPYLTALLVPSAIGAGWFMQADHADVLDFIAARCGGAPSYAVPKDFFVLSFPEVIRLDLLTSNGRFRRQQVADHFKNSKKSTAPG